MSGQEQVRAASEEGVNQRYVRNATSLVQEARDRADMEMHKRRVAEHALLDKDKRIEQLVVALGGVIGAAELHWQDALPGSVAEVLLAKARAALVEPPALCGEQFLDGRSCTEPAGHMARVPKTPHTFGPPAGNDSLALCTCGHPEAEHVEDSGEWWCRTCHRLDAFGEWDHPFVAAGNDTRTESKEYV